MKPSLDYSVLDRRNRPAANCTNQLLQSYRENTTCHEDIACFWDAATLSEKLEKIPELTVYVAADGDGRRDRLDIGFFEENSADGVAENLHVLLWEMLAFHELSDPSVGVICHDRVERIQVPTTSTQSTAHGSTTRMRWWTSFLVASVLYTPTWALHESDVGVVDWHTKLVGVPLVGSQNTAPVFHGDLILTATSSNVLAALNATDGSIGTFPLCHPYAVNGYRAVWRSIHDEDDPILAFKIHDSSMFHSVILESLSLYLLF